MKLYCLLAEQCFLLFQSTSMAYDEVNEDAVYTCVGHPLRRDIENVVNWLLNEDFITAYNSILYFLYACRAATFPAVAGIPAWENQKSVFWLCKIRKQFVPA